MSSLAAAGARLLLAVAAGAIVGVLDLWIYELSLRGFFAGVAAGIVYAVIVLFLFQPGMQRYPLFLAGFAVVAGSLAAVAWWLVCRGSRLWVALVAGSLMALAHFAGQGLLLRRR